MSKLDWRRAKRPVEVKPAELTAHVPEKLLRALVRWHVNGCFIERGAFMDAREIAQALLVRTYRPGFAGIDRRDAWLAAAQKKWHQKPKPKRIYPAQGSARSIAAGWATERRLNG